MTTQQLQALPIQRDPDILGGIPVFAGTRVPIKTVFDYLADDCGLDDFLDNFPTVSRLDALAILDAGSRSLLEQAQQP